MYRAEAHAMVSHAAQILGTNRAMQLDHVASRCQKLAREPVCFQGI